MKYLKLLPMSFFLLGLIACANNPVMESSSKKSVAKNSTNNRFPTHELPVSGCAADEQTFECDRRAILAMLGEYQVTFSFHETAVLHPGYQRKAPKYSGGFETVLLVEDTGKLISLQHILVADNGEIVKHWRQDWAYESATNWQYVGSQRFEKFTRNTGEVLGTWTQSIYEVNDGPRYSGSGRWNHKYGVSTWTSDRGWRPLPRREYSTRDDYQLLSARNRHTITPQGWTHEQDNTKVIRADNNTDTLLVRETGFNEYRRVKQYDFTPALTYWRKTALFWATVRALWNEQFAKYDSIRLRFPTGDNVMIDGIFKLANAYHEDQQMENHKPALADLFRQYVEDGTPETVTAITPSD